MKLPSVYRCFGLSLALALAGLSQAQAELISRQGGKMLHDPLTNISWLADANSFRTQLLQDYDLVNKITAAVPTVTGYQGTFTVSREDFFNPAPNSLGQMTWVGARAWVDYLNIGGREDWRLPEVYKPCYGSYCEIGNEYPRLMQVELGGQPNIPIGQAHNDNYDKFQNIESGWYWTGREERLANGSYSVWGYHTGNTGQGTMPLYYEQEYGPNRWVYGYAMAVVERDIGELPAVPLPGAAWLFLGGLMTLLGSRRQGSKVVSA